MAEEAELIALLEHLGCTRITTKESKDEMGARILCTCPMHEDNSPSFMVRTEYPHIWNCFVCGGGRGVESIIQKSILYQPSTQDKWGRFLYPYKKARKVASQFIDLTRHNLIKPFQERQINEPLPLPVESIYAYQGKIKNAYKYLRGRGIKKSTCIRHDIGWDRHRKRVVCPIKNRNGMIVGFVGRVVTPRDRLKEINASRKARGVPIIPPYLIYNNAPREFMMLGIEHIIPDLPLYVVEGFMDYLTLRQWGFNNVVSILGSSFSEWHMDVFMEKGCKELRLFLDNDKAGAKGVLGIYEALKDELKIKVPQYQDDDGDPDEMGIARFTELANTMVAPHSVSLPYFN